MIEAYSTNVAVAANQPVPFNSISIAKGCSVVRRSATTFLFNECGVYELEFDASGAISDAAAANVVLQLAKNGVLQPQAITQANSTATTDIETFGFKTFVQVPNDNSNCCCVSPVTVQILNGAAAITLANANVTIRKVCCS